MTDIKDLALLAAKETGWYIKDEQIAHDAVELCERFLASYLAEQAPAAWAREWEGDVSDIGNMIIEWNKEDCDDNPNWFPLFTVPPLPEPAPMSQVFMVTNRTSCVAFATAEQAHQYIASFSGSIGGGMSITSVPVISEPAPLPEQGCAECGKKASAGWALYCVKCAEQIKDAPLPEEVREMVERLRYSANLHEYRIMSEAADMLERLAAGEQK